jgi:hypothetical protein
VSVHVLVLYAGFVEKSDEEKGEGWFSVRTNKNTGKGNVIKNSP